VTKD